MNTEYPTSSPGDMSSRTTSFPSSDSLEKVMTVSFLNEAHRACFAFFYYRNRAGIDDGFNTLMAIDPADSPVSGREAFRIRLNIL